MKTETCSDASGARDQYMIADFSKNVAVPFGFEEVRLQMAVHVNFRLLDGPSLSVQMKQGRIEKMTYLFPKKGFSVGFLVIVLILPFCCVY